MYNSRVEIINDYEEETTYSYTVVLLHNKISMTYI